MWELSQEEFNIHKYEIAEKIREGALFIYPTDTVYGLGCDATNQKSVAKLRSAKKIPTRPVSIIAPSKDWIKKNCVITPNAKDWLDKLPGPYTFVLKLKNKDAVAKNVYEKDTIGVRIPDHWISSFVTKLGFPITTTSANITGQPLMTEIDDLDLALRPKIDFAIDAGELKSKLSQIVDLTNTPKIIKR